jgi:hypothetical protein
MHPLASQAGIDIMKRGGNAFEELKQEYFDWGETQGGRGGRAWGIDHARNRRTRLSWWQDQLGLESLGDLVGILPRAEKALRELLKTSAERML